MTDPAIAWDERHGGYWAVSGHQECRAVAGARAGFASAPHVHIPPSGLAKRGLRIYALESDGPEHREQRGVLLDVLGPTASGRFAEHIAALARTLLASLDWTAEPDLAAGYAFQLPLEVICARANITLHVVGGQLRGRTLAAVGAWAERSLADVRVDVAFVGTNGLTVENGLTTPDIAEAMVKRALVAAARRTVVLADHSKVGRTDLALVAPLSAVDTLVTDTGLAAELVDEIEAVGPRVVRA